MRTAREINRICLRVAPLYADDFILRVFGSNVDAVSGVDLLLWI